MITTFKELARVNTGASFLDSGDAYGRHYENGPIPEDAPLEYASVFSDGTFNMLAINGPQLLDEHLEIDQRATRHFRLWAALADPRDEYGWVQLGKEYCERMVETDRWKDPEGRNRAFAYNPYNEDNDLDQIYQIVSPGIYAGVCLVQIHNGCDVRGGYTAPVVAHGDVEELLCSVILSLYCYYCDEDLYSIYDMEEKGWKPIVHKKFVSLRCGKCKKIAMKFPIWEGR